MDAGVGILDVEDRIVLRRFDHFGEIEIHLGFGLAGQHGETHDILADFFDHIRDGDEIARTLGHFHRFAAAQQLDHLDQFHVEGDRLAATFRKGCDRCLDALYRTRVIGTPDVDQFVGILRLLHVIGKIGPEIGPLAVGLPDRAILVVAELGRAEQRQLDRLPVVHYLALGLFENAVIDEVVLAQPCLRLFGLPRRLQRRFG